MVGDVGARIDGPRARDLWLAVFVLSVILASLMSPTTLGAPWAGPLAGPPLQTTAAAGPVRTPPLAAPSALPHGDALPLDDPAEPLVPRSPRNEADEDRLHALSHYSAGRACQHRKQYAEALRHYQRALRWNPSAHGAIQPILTLAEQLQWPDVRGRYLLLAARLDPDALDQTDLIELVEQVSNEDDLRLVTQQFERTLAHRKDQQKTPLDIVLRWRLAEIYVAGKDYVKAAQCAAGVLDALEHPEPFGLSHAALEKLFGMPHPPYWLFGEYFFLADRLAEAEFIFQRAHQTKPDAGRLHYQLARINLKRKRPLAALEHVEACFRDNFADEGDKPCQLLREALAALGQSDELPGRIEKLLADHPQNESLAAFAAERYLASDQLDKAAALYGGLLTKNPNPWVYAGLLAIHRKQGRLEEVLRVLGEAVAVNLSLESLGSQVQTITSNAVFFDKLVATAEKHLAKDPAALGAHAPLAMALLAIEAQRPETADRFFDLALRAAPASESDVLLLWGGNRMASDEFAKAADVFRRGAEGNTPKEDKPIFFYYLASALELDGQTDAALAAARQACQLDRDSPRLAGHEAWILYHAQRYEPAHAAYVQFIERFDADRANSEVRQLLREARLVLSHLEVERGQPAKAAELLEQVLDEFPDDVSAANDLGYLWADEGLHPQRALDMVRRASEAEPNNAAYRDSLGWALFRVGRLEEAAAELEKAAGDLPDGEILDHLGEVYLKLGKTGQADDAWRRAAEAYRKAKQPEAADAVEAKRKSALSGNGSSGQ